jgi:hypothetical protein
MEELIDQREKVFRDVFPEFAFLTLREYQPAVLAALVEALVDKSRGVHIEVLDPYRLYRSLMAGATAYIKSGDAEKFYVNGESRLLENLRVCVACQNGEHERCYIDQAKGSFCSCPCSKAMVEVRNAGEQIGRIRRAFRRVFPAPREE